MKKVYQIIAILSILLNITLIYFFLFRGETVKIENYRKAVVLSPENKEFVLEEMRTFVKSIQLINKGIMENDPLPIIEAGEKSGQGPEHNPPKGLIKALPMDFKQMAFPTHTIFQEMKDSAEVNFNPAQTQRQLDNLLNYCISCHNTYRLATPLEIENQKGE